MKVGELAEVARAEIKDELEEKATKILIERYRELEHAKRVVTRLEKQIRELEEKDLIDLDH
jgi:hypothetical protein